jgi:hypothetical protein
MVRLADHLTSQTDDFILQQQECQDDGAKYNRECQQRKHDTMPAYGHMECHVAE